MKPRTAREIQIQQEAYEKGYIQGSYDSVGDLCDRFVEACEGHPGGRSFGTVSEVRKVVELLRSKLTKANNQD